MIETWAVIPTRDRADDLAACLASLVGQITGAVIVDNADAPSEVATAGLDFDLIYVHRPGQPPNLARLYNEGLNEIQAEYGPSERFNVVELNDDVEVPPGWVMTLDAALRNTSAAAAYTDQISRSDPVFFLGTVPSGHHDHMMGWAHMLRGELGLRWDEQFEWWYGDTDLDFRCRLEHGGVIAVPGAHPVHKHPSQATFESPVLSRIAHEDEARFAAKWNGRT
jgi:GT2 family glycosyltransferase